MIQGYKITKDAARQWMSYHRSMTKAELRVKWNTYTATAEPVTPIQPLPDNVRLFRTFGYVFEVYHDSITAVYPWRPHLYTSIMDV